MLYLCNTGHIARKCPDKDKGTRPGGKSALLAHATPGIAIVPYGNRICLGVVTDDEGFQKAETAGRHLRRAACDSPGGHTDAQEGEPVRRVHRGRRS